MKNVYLFELDSVIISPDECKLAQEKLYMELMKGNTVVLSYNQILSITMFDLLDINQTKYTRDHILKLIKKKRICVSSYNGLKTPSAYISSKMGVDSPDFEYSCLRFLNGYPKNHPLIMNIKAVLEGKETWLSPEDIKNDELTMDNKRILYDYINVIRDLKIHAFEPATHHMYDFEYYIKKVTDAVVSKGNPYLGYQPELIKNAENNIEKMFSILKENDKKIYRSTCFQAINEISDSDSDSIRLCKAILDMSYNYQVERSISNITIPHPMDKDSVAKTVADYYNRHIFSKPKEIELPKETHILAWNIVNDFCDPAEKQKKNGKTNNCHLINKLFKFTLKTFLFVMLIVMFIIIAYWMDYIFVGLILAISAEILIEFISWCLPFDTGFFGVLLPILHLIKHWCAYFSFKKNKPYRISVEFNDYIIEKANNLWKKFKNIFH